MTHGTTDRDKAYDQMRLPTGTRVAMVAFVGSGLPTRSGERDRAGAQAAPVEGLTREGMEEQSLRRVSGEGTVPQVSQLAGSPCVVSSEHRLLLWGRLLLMVKLLPGRSRAAAAPA
eukprot:CAMPEP_0176337852 /NCGR_PEP_ID=MMETSP0121_2-20121125/79842_1 /TAXON_ID=160619 /ORGANISM="Kryptoperidinium foliaceum, Strain CCMP 1326" /LENGTH=115 /DNA_ID=CAMNT_0017680867 /DNA_START=283 /DNA_END=626 /DNA_ORIENTATION=+